MPRVFISQAESVESAVHHIRYRWMEGKSLKQVATLFNLNQATLSREFRRKIGISPKEYVDWLRLEYLCVRLKEDPALGFEIGCELGFPTSASFYKWVRRMTGGSLSQLRAEVHIFSKRTNDNKKRHERVIQKAG